MSTQSKKKTRADEHFIDDDDHLKDTTRAPPADFQRSRPSHSPQLQSNFFPSIDVQGGIANIGASIDNQYNISFGQDETTRQRTRLLQSLSYAEDGLREEQVAEAFPETCQWIWDPRPGTFPSFVHWLANPASIYWITGKPGSGKSTLMKSIRADDSDSRLRHHLHTWSCGCRVHVVSHFFWRAGTAQQKNLVGMLSSLLRQVLQDLPQYVDAYLWDNPEIPPRWTVRQLSEMLKNAISASQDMFCVFIDGLDEFDGDETSREHVLNFVLQLGRMPNAKVCVASRPELALHDHFNCYDTMRVQDLNFDDIVRAAEGRLTQLPRFRSLQQHDSPGTTQLICDLCNRSEGVFLWLHLALENLIRGLRKGDRVPALRERLDSLGNSLDELFTSQISRIDFPHRTYAAGLLALMIQRPRRTQYWGVSLDPAFETGSMPALFAILFDAGPDERPFLGKDYPSALLSEQSLAYCFKSCADFENIISERTGGLLMMSQGMPNSGLDDISKVRNCSAQSLSGCMCSPALGPDDLGAASTEPVAVQRRRFDKLIHHFCSRHLEIIHRSAFDFLKYNPSAQMLMSACNDGVALNARVSRTHQKLCNVRISQIKAHLACLTAICRSDKQSTPDSIHQDLRRVSRAMSDLFSLCTRLRDQLLDMICQSTILEFRMPQLESLGELDCPQSATSLVKASISMEKSYFTSKHELIGTELDQRAKYSDWFLQQLVELSHSRAKYGLARLLLMERSNFVPMKPLMTQALADNMPLRDILPTPNFPWIDDGDDQARGRADLWFFKLPMLLNALPTIDSDFGAVCNRNVYEFVNQSAHLGDVVTNIQFCMAPTLWQTLDWVSISEGVNVRLMLSPRIVMQRIWPRTFLSRRKPPWIRDILSDESLPSRQFFQRPDYATPFNSTKDHLQAQKDMRRTIANAVFPEALLPEVEASLDNYSSFNDIVQVLADYRPESPALKDAVIIVRALLDESWPKSAGQPGVSHDTKQTRDQD